MVANEDVYIRVLTLEDSKDVGLMLMLYLEEEPTAKCMDLSDHEKKIFIETYLQKALPQNMSVGSFEKTTGKMCGCAIYTNLNAIIRPEHFDRDPSSTPHLDCLSRLDSIMDKRTEQIAAKLGAKNVMYMELGVMEPRYQRRGVGDRIQFRAEQLATEMNFDLIVGVANSHSSATLVAKHGFTPDMKISYANYRDSVTKEVVFANIPAPHTGAVVVYKQLFKSKY